MTENAEFSVSRVTVVLPVTLHCIRSSPTTPERPSLLIEDNVITLRYTMYIDLNYNKLWIKTPI